MSKSSRRETFHFGRPLTEAPNSLSPYDIYKFVDSAAGLLIPKAATLDRRAKNVLTHMPTLDFAILPSRIVRVARTRVRGSRHQITTEGLRAALYDRMPVSKTGTAIGRIIGAEVIGQGNVLALELESPELAAEREAAVDAVREVFGLSQEVDLELSDHLDLSLGHFAGGVDDSIADTLGSITAAAANDKALTFLPIPNPHESPPPQA